MADDEIVHHITNTTGLSESVARRVVDDVIAYHREPLTAYVRRRHQQLQTHGVRNPAAFEQIHTELQHRVVAATPQSLRQIRRIIYG